MELRVVGTMSDLVASEASSFLDILLSFGESKVYGPDPDIFGWLLLSPVAVTIHGVGELPLVVECGCLLVPFLDGGRQRSVTVNLVSQCVIETGLEEGDLGDFFLDSGSGDESTEFDDVIIGGRASLFKVHEAEAILSLMIDSSEGFLQKFLEVVPCAIS